MPMDADKGRRAFLRGAAALPLAVGAQGAAAQDQATKKVTIAFAGLCAFVVDGDSLKILFPDAHKDESRRPAHGASMAYFTADDEGQAYPRLKDPLLTVPLVDVHLR